MLEGFLPMRVQVLDIVEELLVRSSSTNPASGAVYPHRPPSSWKEMWGSGNRWNFPGAVWAGFLYKEGPASLAFLKAHWNGTKIKRST